MREFKTAHGDTVDLTNPDTYSYMSKDIVALCNKIQQEIGFCYCYFNYWHPDWCEKQKARVEVLIQVYAKERRENLKNLLWHQEMLYLIEDEIENMC